jgi:hypothetical protein
MRRSADDRTAGSAIGNVSGESLLAYALERIDDELDRVLILAHIALDAPLSTLVRALKVERTELAARVDRALDMLRDDEVLSAQLGDVLRAGEHEHYQTLALRLNLQDWFCSQCGGLMVQRGVGRPRSTCNSRCRRLLFEAGGASWKDQHEKRPSGANRPDGDHVHATIDSPGGREKLRAVIGPIESGALYHAESPLDYWTVQARDRAMVLLGFACPVPLTPSDLVALDVDDVRSGTNGLEIRLFRRAARATRYVTLPRSTDAKLCAVTAVTHWRSTMVSLGRTTGPLFVRLSVNYGLSFKARRVGRQAAADVVNRALVHAAGAPLFAFKVSTQFSDILDGLELVPTQRRDMKALTPRGDPATGPSTPTTS